MGDQGEPLLAHAREDELWDAVEGGRRGPRDTFTVRHLLREHPTEVLKTLQNRSVRRVAEFMVEVRQIRARAGPALMMTWSAGVEEGVRR